MDQKVSGRKEKEDDKIRWPGLPAARADCAIRRGTGRLSAHCRTPWQLDEFVFSGLSCCNLAIPEEPIPDELEIFLDSDLSDEDSKASCFTQEHFGLIT